MGLGTYIIVKWLTGEGNVRDGEGALSVWVQAGHWGNGVKRKKYRDTEDDLILGEGYTT